MRSHTLNLVKLTLLTAFFIGLFCPAALGLDQLYTVPTDPGASCWASSTGSFFDSTYYISLTRPETDTVTGLVFQYFNCSRSDLINEATLRLYFDIEFDPGSSHVTIYGYDNALGPTFFSTSGQLLSAPVTSHYVNLDLSGISSPGWVEIDVTAIIQEIVNRPYWYLSDNIGLVIYGARDQPHRTIVSNSMFPTKWPQLNVTWAETDNPATEQYRGYTITPAYNNQITGYFYQKSLYWWLSYLPETESIYYSSGSWVEVNTTIPIAVYTSNAHTVAVSVHGKLYAALPKRSNPNDMAFYSADINDPTNFTELCTLTDMEASWDICYDPDNDIIHYACIGTGGIRYQKIYLSNNTASSYTTLYTGFPGYSEMGIDIEYLSNGALVMAGSCPSSTNSNRYIRTKYKLPGEPWSPKEDLIITSGTMTGYPWMLQLYDKVILVGSEPSNNRETYWVKDIDDLATAWDKGPWFLTSSGGPSYCTLYYLENWLSEDFSYRDALVYLGTKGTGDIRISANVFTYSGSTISLDAHNIYGNLANETGADWLPIWYVQKDGLAWPLNYRSGKTKTNFMPPAGFNWAPHTGYLSFGDSIGNLNSNVVQTITISNYNRGLIQIPDYVLSWIVTPPTNGTAPDPDCLAAAQTLEEVEACINNALGGSDPLDPDPPGWSEEGDPEISRPALTMMFLGVGLGCMFIPSMWMIYKKAWEALPIVLFLIIVGLGLLWSLGTI